MRPKPTAAGASAPETTIALLAAAVRELGKPRRDAASAELGLRITAFLARFPVHVVTEFVEQTATGPVLRQVPAAEWPTWARPCAERATARDTDGCVPAFLDKEPQSP